jgi:ATP-dependent DNA helicase PIF1
MTPQEELIAEIKLSLNEDQQKAFDQCVNGNSSVFCTGQGGTGKSWLLECVVTYFRRFPPPDNGLLAVTASTGIAAFLVKGITLHRFAGVGIEETNLDAMIMRASRGVSRTYWTTTSILIIDEVSMISATFFENLSLLAKNLRRSDQPFGGMRLIMFGDFLQLPPISKIDHPSVRIIHTDAWAELSPKIAELKQIVRQTDREFVRVLSELRYGVCTDDTERYIQGLDREVTYEDGVEPVKLFAKKDTTEAYNLSMLSGLNSSPVTYKSIDSGDIALLRQCPAPQTLQLKQGSQVMVIRNLSNNIVNGSVGTVVGFDTTPGSFLRKPKVRLVMLDGSSSVVTINRVEWETIAPGGRVAASRVQFPLILAWAVTIHKSQGQTLSRVSVDMSGIFENGQAYVALSRCSDPANLTVVNFNKNLVTAAPSCVRFYQELNSEASSSELPDYSIAAEGEDPPEYTEDSATDVADATQETWDNTEVQPPPIQGHTLDTEIMLGNLSLQENSNGSQLDFES